MIFLQTLLFLAVNVGPSYGEEIRGVIERKNKVTYLKSSTTDKRVAIKAASRTIETSLNDLSDGDYLVADAEPTAQSNSYSVKTIRSIGLKKLIGFWRTVDWKIFEFLDHTKLNLYLPTHVLDTEAIYPFKQIHYKLGPSGSNHYSIILVDSQEIGIGTLTVYGGKLYLALVNHETGKIKEVIELKPVYEL